MGKGRDALEEPEDVRSCWGRVPRSPAGEFRNRREVERRSAKEMHKPRGGEA